MNNMHSQTSMPADGLKVPPRPLRQLSFWLTRSDGSCSLRLPEVGAAVVLGPDELGGIIPKCRVTENVSIALQIRMRGGKA